MRYFSLRSGNLSDKDVALLIIPQFLYDLSFARTVLYNPSNYLLDEITMTHKWRHLMAEMMEITSMLTDDPKMQYKIQGAADYLFSRRPIPQDLRDFIRQADNELLLPFMTNLRIARQDKSELTTAINKLPPKTLFEEYALTAVKFLRPIDVLTCYPGELRNDLAIAFTQSGVTRWTLYVDKIFVEGSLPAYTFKMHMENTFKSMDIISLSDLLSIIVYSAEDMMMERINIKSQSLAYSLILEIE
jgi:hypothetical protein